MNLDLVDLLIQHVLGQSASQVVRTDFNLGPLVQMAIKEHETKEEHLHFSR
jgi:hypothetical protein